MPKIHSEAGDLSGNFPSSSRGRALLGYSALVGATAALFLLIRSYGETLAAPAPAAALSHAVAPAHSSTAAPLLLALVVILAASRLLGALFRRFHQPPVIGEVLAGILLGPSLFGRVAPAAATAVFPQAVTPLLGVVAQVGVLLFMFVVGLELNTAHLRERSGTALAISHASILVPFLMGTALALFLYPRLSSRDVSFTVFALFLGVSLSVTAFPVLARILTDRGLQRTSMGTLALTCAAVDDVTAWCLLALVVGVVHARLGGAALTALLTLLYVGAMFGLVRPLAHRAARWYEQEKPPAQTMMALACAALLLSSLATEYIGIHTLFGAFLLGAVIPHDSRAARDLTDRLEDFVVVVLLPAFFAFTGLRTQIGLISGGQWLLCALIILAACLGKFSGTAVAARLTGLGWRDASALGVLMNTRGLMELIVLNVGLDLKVISPRLFAMLVIMAVVTTFATTPILDALTRGEWEEAA
jgi:Kef-type K+ transport system membrane component KefB